MQTCLNLGLEKEGIKTFVEKYHLNHIDWIVSGWREYCNMAILVGGAALVVASLTLIALFHIPPWYLFLSNPYSILI